MNLFQERLSIFSEVPLVKNAIIASIVFSFFMLTGALRVVAQEVVYVLPVSPGSAPVGGGPATDEAPILENADESETDLRNRGLWRPRVRHDLFARPGNARPDAGPGTRAATGDATNDGRRAATINNSVRNAPVGGDLSSSRVQGGAIYGRSAPGAVDPGRSGGVSASSSGLTQPYSSGGSGVASSLGGEASMAGENRAATGRTGQREEAAREGNALRRTASVRPNPATAPLSGAAAVDGENYGPPEDFGITAQGLVDPLTGEVLPARAPVVTGATGQPRQSASQARTSATFNTAVGAAGTSVNRPVEGAITTIGNRSRPEWDSLGARWGRFLVRPSIDIETEYTDNASLSASNRKSDVRMVLRPSIRADSDFSRHGLSLNLSGEIGRHARLKTEDYVGFDASALGRLDVRRNTTIDTELRYSLSQEERSTTGAVSGAAKRPFIHGYHASVRGTQRFNRLSVSLRGAIDFTDYDDTTLSAGGVVSNDDRDYRDFSTTARLSYDVRPGMRVYTQGRYSARRHSQRFDNSGIARNSDGVSAEIGAALALGRHMRADLAIGYIRRDYEDGSLNDVSAFSANADISWNISELTTLRGAISTSVDETTVANASANVVREVMFGVDHELLRNFVIGGELSLSDTRAIGSNTRDVAYVVDLSADYRLNRKASITAHLTRRKQYSTRANADYTEHTATIGLNLRL